MAQLVSSLPPVPAYPAAHLLLSAPGALRPAGFGRLGASIHALQAGPAGDGSQKPDDGAASVPAVRAGRNTDSAGRAYWVVNPGESLPLDPVEAEEVVTGRKDGHEQLAPECRLLESDEARHARVLTNAERLLAELAIALPALRGAA